MLLLGHVLLLLGDPNPLPAAAANHRDLSPPEV